MGVHYPNLVKSIAPLRLYCRFGETSGTVAADSGPYGYAGTHSGVVVGGASSVGYCPGDHSAAYGAVAGAFTSWAIPPYSGTTPFTVSFCLKITSSGFLYTFSQWDSAGYRNGWGIYVNGSSLGLEFWSANNYVGGAGVNYAPGVWQHHSISFGGSNCAWAINGASASTFGRPSFGLTSQTLQLGSAGGYGANYYIGGGDEIVVWDAALTSPQQAALAAAWSQKFLPRRRGPGRRAA